MANQEHASKIELACRSAPPVFAKGLDKNDGWVGLMRQVLSAPAKVDISDTDARDDNHDQLLITLRGYRPNTRKSIPSTLIPAAQSVCTSMLESSVPLTSHTTSTNDESQPIATPHAYTDFDFLSQEIMTELYKSSASSTPTCTSSQEPQDITTQDTRAAGNLSGVNSKDDLTSKEERRYNQKARQLSKDKARLADAIKKGHHPAAWYTVAISAYGESIRGVITTEANWHWCLGYALPLLYFKDTYGATYATTYAFDMVSTLVIDAVGAAANDDLLGEPVEPLVDVLLPRLLSVSLEDADRQFRQMAFESALFILSYVPVGPPALDYFTALRSNGRYRSEEGQSGLRSHRVQYLCAMMVKAYDTASFQFAESCAVELKQSLSYECDEEVLETVRYVASRSKRILSKEFYNWVFSYWQPYDSDFIY